MVRAGGRRRDYTLGMNARPWFADAFDARYLDVYAHRSAEQAQAQVKGMLACGLLPQAGRVLDIGCGAGRHLRAMRRAGLDARGLDYSADLLRAGGLCGVAVRADMRAIPFAEGLFDRACSLFTSFGYFDDPEQDLRVLREAARVLKPGGALVLDHINPGPTLAALVPQSVDERDGACLTQRRTWDASARVLTKELQWSQGDDTRCWQERVRLYEPAELDALLRRAGFGALARYADLNGSRWQAAASPRQVVLAWL